MESLLANYRGRRDGEKRKGPSLIASSRQVLLGYHFGSGPRNFFECPRFLSEYRKKRNESAETHHAYGQSHEAF
jgi:hypothetical protein